MFSAFAQFKHVQVYSAERCGTELVLNKLAALVTLYQCMAIIFLKQIATIVGLLVLFSKVQYISLSIPTIKY